MRTIDCDECDRWADCAEQARTCVLGDFADDCRSCPTRGDCHHAVRNNSGDTPDPVCDRPLSPLGRELLGMVRTINAVYLAGMKAGGPGGKA